jgi:GT2 family glycosyltransferase
MPDGLDLLPSNHEERDGKLTMPKTAVIVIVNWNCWEDTARCINACGHLIDFFGSVLVVDNGSTDESLRKLKEWGAGLLEVSTTSKTPKIGYLETASNEPLAFGGLFDEPMLSQKIEKEGLASRSWYLVDAKENAGFGAGNNVGLRIAMRDPRCSLFWCLNADAIPGSDSWKEFFSVCNRYAEAFISGSVLLNYDGPDSVQTIGSSFSRSTLLVSYQYENEPVATLNTLPEKIAVGYPIGASLLINRKFLEQHGFFDERYFLYYEEPDLVVRLEKPDLSFVCTRSMVYHKGGQTTGGGDSILNRSRLADYQYNRSRMILARKLGGITIFLSAFAAFYSIFKRMLCGRFDLARSVIPASIEGWRCAR